MFQGVIREWRETVKNRKLLVPVIGVCLIPFLYGALLLWAFWDPYAQTENLPVAVVNEDEGININEESIQVGNELIQELEKEDTFDWQSVDRAQAEEGLEDHSFYFAVFIEEEFSEQATEVLTTDPEKAKLTYSLQPGYNFVAAQVGEQAVTELEQELERALISTYAAMAFEQLDDGENDLAYAVEGAGEVAAGSRELERGANEIEGHLDTLTHELMALYQGAGKGSEGNAELLGGANELKHGSGRLVESSEQVATQLEAALPFFQNRAEDALAQANQMERKLEALPSQFKAVYEEEEKRWNEVKGAITYQEQKLANRWEKGWDQIDAYIKAVEEEALTAADGRFAEQLDYKTGTLSSNETMNQVAEYENEVKEMITELKRLNEKWHEELESFRNFNNKETLANEWKDWIASTDEWIDATLVRLEGWDQESLNRTEGNFKKWHDDVKHQWAVLNEEVNQWDEKFRQQRPNWEKVETSDSHIHQQTESLQQELEALRDNVEGDEAEKVDAFYERALDHLEAIDGELDERKRLTEEERATDGGSKEAWEEHYTRIQDVELPAMPEDHRNVEPHIDTNEQVETLMEFQEQMNALAAVPDETVADQSTHELDFTALEELYHQQQEQLVSLEESFSSTMWKKANVEQNTNSNATPKGNDIESTQRQELVTTRADHASTYLQAVKEEVERELAAEKEQLQTTIQKREEAAKNELDYLFGKYHPQVIEGTHQLQTLQTTGREVVNQSEQLPEYATRLQSVALQLHQGHQDLQSGVLELHDAWNSIEDAGNDLVSGANDIHEGSVELEEGLLELSHGSRELEEGLTEGKQALADLERGEEVEKKIAAPVESSEMKEQEIPNYGFGLTPYFLSLGLYVGALTLSIVFPFRDPLGAPSSALNWFSGKLGFIISIGAAQALIIILTMLFGIGLEVESIWRFVVFTLLTSFTFMTIVHTLITWLGDPGRFIAIILLILQLGASAGTFPIELVPEPLQMLHPFLPMTYAVLGFRSVIALGDWSVFLQSSLILLGISFIFMMLSYLYCYLRQRQYKNSEREEIA
ncbi:YhgE/Pip family protein [Salsuginibacillus kocurii]|uniref:YhgE/Pip family protein n=1 Tax=Salsuginibacillus kocurii TaxID=427078 RepID=UPI000366A65A|nr:YhgE/Pip domain-containing protein [Salsuginibacillus kocurii]